MLFFSEHWWRGEGEKLLFIHKKSYREKGNDRFWPQRRPTLPIKINRQGSCVCGRTVGDPRQPPLTHWQLELTVSGTRTASHLSTHVTQHPCHSKRLSLSPLNFLVKVQDEEFNVSWGNLYPKAMRVTASVPQPLHPSVATSKAHSAWFLGVPTGLSPIAHSCIGATLPCSTRLLIVVAFPFFSLLWNTGSRHTGLVAPWHVESSQTWHRTCVPCIGRQIPIHCSTREVLAHPWLTLLPSLTQFSTSPLLHPKINS